jgi:hypothetical protein
MIRLLALFFSASLLLGGSAHALDAEFVTADGFDTIVTSFNFIALFFSNQGYLNLVYTFAVAGLALGCIVSFVKSGGDLAAPVRTFVLFVFSAGLFTGAIISKGNVQVYDPVTNRTQTVADVPDLIVFLAGTTNAIQQVAEQVSNTAVPAIGFDDVHDATLFDLLEASIQGPLPIQDEAFFRTLKSYYKDCVFYAEAVPSNNLTFQELVHDSTNLRDSFAKAAVPSGWAAWFSNGDPRTGTDSCQNIWNNMLAPRIDAASSYDDFEASICRSESFNPADPLQLAACREDLDRIPGEIYGQAGGDRLLHYRQVLIARALQDANFEENPAVAIQTLANVQQTSKAVGVLTVLDAYGPSVRAAFLGASLVMLPIIFLFVMTPLFKKVLQIALSLFVFAALWSVLDTALDQVAHTLALNAFSEIGMGGYAYNDIITSPSAAARAFSSFGTMRLVSVTLSTLVAVQVFGLSGAPFSSIGNQIQGEFASVGASAGGRVMDPVQNAGLLRQTSDATSTQQFALAGGQEAFAGLDESGYRRLASSSAEGLALGSASGAVGRAEGSRSGGRAIATARGVMSEPGGGYAVGSREGRQGIEDLTEGLRAREDAGLYAESVGGAPAGAGTRQVARAKAQGREFDGSQGGFDPQEARGAAIERSERSYGDTEGFSRAARRTGNTTRGLSSDLSQSDTAFRAGASKDIDKNPVFDGTFGAGEDHRAAQIGAAETRDAWAEREGLTGGAEAAAAEARISTEEGLASKNLRREVADHLGLSIAELTEVERGQFTMNVAPGFQGYEVLREKAPDHAHQVLDALPEHGGRVTFTYNDGEGIGNLSLYADDSATVTDAQRFDSGQSYTDNTNFAPDTLNNWLAQGDTSFLRDFLNAPRDVQDSELIPTMAENLARYEQRLATDRGSVVDTAGEENSRAWNGSADVGVRGSIPGISSVSGGVGAGISGRRGSSESVSESRSFDVDRAQSFYRDALEGLRDNADRPETLNMLYAGVSPEDRAINEFSEVVEGRLSEFRELSDDTASRTDNPDDDFHRRMRNVDDHHTLLEKGGTTTDSNEFEGEGGLFGRQREGGRQGYYRSKREQSNDEG